MTILGALSITRRTKFSLVARTVALLYFGTLSPIQALPLQKSMPSNTSSYVISSICVIAYILMTLTAASDTPPEEGSGLPDNVSEEASGLEQSKEISKVNESLENESVETLVSILDAPDDKHDEVNNDEEDDVANQSTPLIIDKVATEPLIMITWNRYQTGEKAEKGMGYWNIIIVYDGYTYTKRRPNRNNTKLYFTCNGCKGGSKLL